MKPGSIPVAARATQGRLPLSKPEKYLLLLGLAWVLLALLGPYVAQYPDDHAFADQSQLWGLSHWGDVWSNVPIMGVGVWGVWRSQGSSLSANWPALYERQQLFFYGLVLAGLGSFAHHLTPSDQTLWLDRLGICGHAGPDADASL
ncbi:MAG: hypothetical protein KBC57_13225 [Neisseriaceae bacterium]|nr:hypothetical protein [Neisseriaceae bacterium]